MKKVMMFAVALTAVVYTQGVSAQKASKAAPGATIETQGVIYHLPRTVLKVQVTEDRQVIKRGPYARFAQRYLGVIAPLSDKENYYISSVSVVPAQEADPAAVYVLDSPEKSAFTLYTSTIEGFIQPDFGGVVNAEERFAAEIANSAGGKILVHSNVWSDTSFVRLPIDKSSAGEVGQEEMASRAANTIFTLHRRRFDLITGEAGENVYGEGLKAALEEMRKIEEEYVALFMGVTYTVRTVREFDVIPEADKTAAIVCRFAEGKGILPDTDLSGRPIVMTFLPEGKTTAVTSRSGSKGGTVFYRTADIAGCKISDGERVLFEGRVPVYQFGQIIEVPVAAVK